MKTRFNYKQNFSNTSESVLITIVNEIFTNFIQYKREFHQLFALFKLRFLSDNIKFANITRKHLQMNKH